MHPTVRRRVDIVRVVMAWSSQVCSVAGERHGDPKRSSMTVWGHTGALRSPWVRAGGQPALQASPV